MISRRRFAGLAGSAAVTLVAAPHIARTQSLPLVRLGNAAGLIDPQVTFLTMGQHPRLKYYEEEGCQMEIVNLSGVGQSIQAVAGGKCETSAISPVAFLSVYAKNPNIDVVFPYCWLRQAHWSVAVKPDSPVKIAERPQGQEHRHPQPGRHRLFRRPRHVQGARHRSRQGRGMDLDRRGRSRRGGDLSRPRRRHGVLGRQLRAHRNRGLPAAPDPQCAGHQQAVRQLLRRPPVVARQGARPLCAILPRHGEVDRVRARQSGALHPAALGALSGVEAQG